MVYSCCIFYLLSCAFTCVTEFLLALIRGLLVVIGYTHTLVRIGVTIVTHTQIVIISPPVLCWSCLYTS